MFNDQIIRTPINGTAALVVNQKGCVDELTPEQERACIISRLRNLKEESSLLPKKDGRRVEIGLQIQSLELRIKDLRTKMKKVNINSSNRGDFSNCVFNVMRDQLSVFQYKQIIRLAEDMHRKELENNKECFSCGDEFEAEERNDRDEGYFCDECLTDRR